VEARTIFNNCGSYSLGGSIGQADAGSLSSAAYELNSGFWGGTSINYSLYLPLTLKNSLTSGLLEVPYRTIDQLRLSYYIFD
jgi:hypothetical protein